MPLVALLLLLIPVVAQANQVDIEVRNAVLEGEAPPAVILRAHRPVAKATLVYTLTSVAEGATPLPERTVSLSNLAAGSTGELTLKVPPGAFAMRGELRVIFSDGGEAVMPLNLDVEVAQGFGIEVLPERVHVSRGEIELKLTRAAGRCEYVVQPEGRPPLQGETQFAGEAPGTWLSVRWDPYPASVLVLKVTLRCYDVGDVFNTGIELYPWSVSVPHEDVVFASGKWDVVSAEMPKLQEAQAEIQKAADRYGKLIAGVTLYVAGHTDTVGSAESNLTLSRQRARSIAKALRRLGVRIPIKVAGFGEERLAQGTPDETPEAKNRRAEYIIGVTPPMAPPAGQAWEAM